MLKKVLTGKIHQARITQCDLDYVGSITIDEDLLRATGMVPNEFVNIADLDNGARFETYVIKGEAGSGVICLNGAAARKVQVGDILIIISYVSIKKKKADKFKPLLVFPDENNRLS